MAGLLPYGNHMQNHFYFLTIEQVIENPEHYWTSSIGACGLACFFHGSWKGSYIAGGLALRNLSRAEIKWL
jgi:glucose/arabinose dehydrogenase